MWNDIQSCKRNVEWLLEILVLFLNESYYINLFYFKINIESHKNRAEVTEPNQRK